MKYHKSISKFLQIHVKKSESKSKAQAEVVALAPRGSSKNDNVVLHEDFEAYSATTDRLRKTEELTATAGATCFVRFGGRRGGEHLLLVGVGTEKEGVDAIGSFERLRRLGAVTAQKLVAERVRVAVVHFDSFLLSDGGLEVEAQAAARAYLEGFGMAVYKFDKYFSKKKNGKAEKFELIVTGGTPARVHTFEQAAEEALGLIQAVEITRDLGNEPSNFLYPSLLAKEATAVAKQYQLKCHVLDEKILRREGMGLLLGVGQGSANPPRLVVLEYNPKKSGPRTKTIAFVGKGVTFDSGGISIKPAAKMEDMKHDMCGSAAVLGAIAACSALGVQTRVIAVLAIAENMPDGAAIQPGNILTARNGKTVEVINTDAEGRLVLGDALDYVQDMKPDYVIDLATLTGAVSITLGKSAAGLMGNDEEFNRLVRKAAKESGERVWELPLFEEYFEDLKSEYADMRNSGDTPYHGTAKGGMFLLQFIRKGTKWAHLDIAAMASGNSLLPYNPRKASTGFGVRLLVELAQQLAS